MDGQPGPSSPLSPISPRTAKAGLFRARSPPPTEQFSAAAFDLHGRMDPFGVSSNGRLTPDTSSEGHSLVPPRNTGRSVEGGYASSAGASLGHTPPLPHTARTDRPLSPPATDAASPGDLVAGLKGATNAPNGSGYEDIEERDEIPESSVMGLAGGSDEMLMTLLAGQAAVDCEQLQVGGWEEVESWKKVSNYYRDDMSITDDRN